MTTKTAQRVFEYTDDWSDDEDFTSTSVDRLLVNRNTGEVAVEWKESDHETYIFSGVPRNTLDTLLDGSVGSNVARLKRDHGPAERLDKCWDLDQRPVSVVQNGFSAVAVYTAPVEAHAREVVSGITTVSKDYTYRLFWDLDGTERETVFSADVKSLDEALERLNQQAKALGLNVVVKRAVIDFV